MILEHLSLSRQMDMVFKEIIEELSNMTSGTVFVQIRNNCIGKFGVRHDAMQSRDGQVKEPDRGLTESQRIAFGKLAIHALKYKRHWTHGEIFFDFAVKQDTLVTSIQFESHYNMAALLTEKRFNNSNY